MRTPRWLILRLVKRNLCYLFIFIAIVTVYYLSRHTHTEKPREPRSSSSRHLSVDRDNTESFEATSHVGEIWKNVTSENVGKSVFAIDTNKILVTNPNVHVFYYAWYGSPEFDGQWSHWNHQYIPPWDKTDHKVYPSGSHVPPLDVAANYYPALGPYSSRDPAVIDRHMSMVAESGAGVLALSWYPPGMADENGLPSDSIVPMLLEKAGEYGLKVCLHVEPYKTLSAETLRKQLEYVQTTYGSHPAYYKIKRGLSMLPLFYIYDSYRVAADQWRRLFSRKGDLTVRDTHLDGVFLGLLVEYKHRFDIKSAGFDGFYTYFASDGFSYGSSWKNWRSLANYARKSSLIFVPSVGPGYRDTRVRAWNGKNSKARLGGSYYETAWKTALDAEPRLVSVTSFNEWHEGTQIEAAVAAQCEGYTYENYLPHTQSFYLDLTRKWMEKFFKRNRTSSSIGLEQVRHQD